MEIIIWGQEEGKYDVPVGPYAIGLGMCGPTMIAYAGAEHLKALARVSRTLRDEDICAKLRSTFDPSAIYAILTDNKAEQAA